MSAEKTNDAGTAVAAGGNFEELLKSLDAVASDADNIGQGGDDANVAAAAGADGGDEDGDDDGDDIPKSAAASDEFVDATELVKSLMERQDSTDGVLAKAMGQMATVLGKQNDLIKSLQAEVKALASQGRGRKAVLSFADKPPIGDLAKSNGADDNQITPADLLAKSQSAFAAGKLSGVEANTIDVCLRNGWAIEPTILRKIAAA